MTHPSSTLPEALSDQAPQLVSATIMAMLMPGYAVPSNNTWPSNPNPGDLFDNTSLQQYGQWENGAWTNLGPDASSTFGSHLPTGASPFQLYDTYSGGQVDLFIIYETDTGDPLLMTDRGFVVKKDFWAGGELVSEQGILILGYDWESTVYSGSTIAQSPPMIQLMNSSSTIPSGNSLPSLSEMDGSPAGQLFNYTPSGGPNELYIWTGSTWNPSETTNFSGYYDTVYLVTANAYTPGNLNLGNLFALGNITLEASNGSIGLQANGWIQWGNPPTAKLAESIGTRGFSGTPALATQSGSGVLGIHQTSGLQVDHIDSATGGGIYLFDKITTTSTYPFETQNNVLDDGSGNQTIVGNLQLGSGVNGTSIYFGSPSSNVAQISGGTTSLGIAQANVNWVWNLDILNGNSSQNGTVSCAGLVTNNVDRGSGTLSCSTTTVYGPYTNDLVWYLYCNAGGTDQGFTVYLSPDNVNWYQTHVVNGYTANCYACATVIQLTGWRMKIESVGNFNGSITYFNHYI